MDEQLKKIDELMAGLTVSSELDSPQLSLARERLKTVKQRVESHVAEMKDRAEKKAKQIAEKEAELAALKGVPGQSNTPKK